VSALVGHRIQGLDEPAVRAWLRKPENRGARFNSQILSSWYAVIWNSTDRLPPADLGALVEELEGPPVAQVHEDGLSTVRPERDDPTASETVFPWPFFSQTPKKFPPGMKLKSERAYFADAYAAVARGEYETAVTRFMAMAEHYSLEQVALPYVVYAALKTGDKLGMARFGYVGGGSRTEEDFDARLTQAFVAASRNNVSEARRLLSLAHRVRPNTDYRPVLTEFQYAQACEWLFRDTRDEGFRTMLLEWLKSQQRIQPTQGWAYAMQYTHEPNAAERIRALAMARYLEPASDRIRGASKSEVEQARKWFRANNPFKEDAEDASPETASSVAMALIEP
jgi:hypothetical protein